ncbi:cytochrome c oxidase subunit II [Nitriliruptoraceae bacterium ZYF776]|nr:cytochrome c oxidase subunit II [Profundirhabdus halotolerans]
MRDRIATRIAARRSTITKVSLVVVLALVLGACTSDQSALDPAGPYAQRPHDLIQWVFGIAVAVFVLVQGLVIYSVVKFRRRKDDDGSLPVQVHGNTRLEIFWTVIPALILAAIAVPTVQMIFTQMEEPEDALTVEVIGHRWWWEYYYPEFDIYTANELVIPAGRTVRLEMTAADPARDVSRGVLHSYWIPQLGGKQDVVPGQTTYLNYEADEPGTYLGQCAEYCGLSHAYMRNYATAMTEADFDAWVEAQTTPAAVPTGGLEAEGRALFEDLGDGRQACVACHAVFDGENVTSRGPGQGPDLTHLFSRERFAGAVTELDEESLAQWLRDPDSIKPMNYDETGVGMPNLDLTEDEIDALVAYLSTLE